jgi:hypothetical protein
VRRWTSPHAAAVEEYGRLAGAPVGHVVDLLDDALDLGRIDLLTADVDDLQARQIMPPVGLAPPVEPDEKSTRPGCCLLRSSS